jgi:hypothetical protein
MSREKKFRASGNSANLGFEATLWSPPTSSTIARMPAHCSHSARRAIEEQ